MDFRGEHSAAAILKAFAKGSSAPDAVLFGGNFEDPLDEPITRADLDRSVGSRQALLARADMHSCVVSSALLEELDLQGVPGVDRGQDGRPTGYLREQAASAAWSHFDASLSPAAQKKAVLAAVSLAYSKGVTSVHEMFVVEWRGWHSLEAFFATVDEVALEVVVYPGTSDVQRVASMGLDRIGGDFFLDGSFGSHTAWMAEPYDDEPPSGSSPTGISYRSDDELLELFSTAQERGMQVGVHAIGDAAIEQAISAWEKVAADVGNDGVAALGHRIEHFECSTDDHLRRTAALGLGASVQPAFDLYWGGSDGLYARRIGARRARGMNRFNSMLNAGVRVGAGSDSTVTPLDPFLQMAALRRHHVASESVDAATALAAHTVWARGLAHVEPARPWSGGVALLDRDPLEVDVDELMKTEVLGTWVGGTRVWPEAEAEAV
jgi:hypothetical protein